MIRVRPAGRFTLSFLLTCAIGAAGCTEAPMAPDAVPLGDNTALQGGVQPQQPWQIQATVAVTPAPPPAGCLAYLTSVIEGTATYLGRFSGTGSTCITSQVAPDSNPPFTPKGPGPYATAEFTNPLWTLTAANGDELRLEGYDSVAVISLTDNSLKGAGRMRVVGGTGRFEGATGDAAVSGLNDDGVGPDDFSGRGWIRFDR